VDSFRFIFMADCQLGCYASFSGMDNADIARFAARDMRVEAVPITSDFDWDAEQYRRAVAAANRLGVDFVVMGGDMVDSPASEPQREALLQITAGLEVPMHWVPGNHDAADDTVVPSTGSLRRYRSTFGPDHYSFEHDGVTFIVANSVIWQQPQLVGDEWDSQFAELEAALRAARGSRHIVVFGHHPLFTAEANESDDYWNIPVVRRRPILDLFAVHQVRAYFCGHWHRNGGGVDGNLEVVVTGPVGYPLGADPSGFRVVDVDDAGLHHRYVPLEAGG
jgi:3',5'-cyclic AMP phosphodiesterase CpdA